MYIIAHRVAHGLASLSDVIVKTMYSIETKNVRVRKETGKLTFVVVSILLPNRKKIYFYFGQNANTNINKNKSRHFLLVGRIRLGRSKSLGLILSIFSAL